ncbi:uncharacterized protein LOC119683274 [Teleopsis dalmanni]|uniref:uncharacterized protein LOC119683274 n=1 Tax=Teleopsis dalmanni TaxID=139649 RepID=UPI0018CCE68C|nr:uncharacterized protein LOC119683274 [Teleopsis dalmanni]
MLKIFFKLTIIIVVLQINSAQDFEPDWLSPFPGRTTNKPIITTTSAPTTKTTYYDLKPTTQPTWRTSTYIPYWREPMTKKTTPKPRWGSDPQWNIFNFNCDCNSQSGYSLMRWICSVSNYMTTYRCCNACTGYRPSCHHNEYSMKSSEEYLDNNYYYDYDNYYY